jgi:hypothetical protein
VQDFIIQFIVSSVVSLGFTGFLVYLVKKYLSEKIKAEIKYEYDLKLNLYKNELSKQSSRELEELKTTLKIFEIKSNIKLSRLHEKQAETLEVIHQYLWELFDSLNDYTTIFQARNQAEKDVKRNLVVDKLEQLREFIKFKSLYLSSELCVKLSGVVKDTQITAIKFLNEVEKDSSSDSWDAIHENVNTEIKSAVDDLVNEFRQILGAS